MISEHPRDAGLVRGIGTFGLAAGIVNGVVGAGIFALPSAMAHDAGPWAPAAFAICAVAMATVVVCFAEAGSRVATSGGPYGFVAAALGPGAGFIAGLMLWLSSVAACGGIAAALADSVAALIPSLFASGPFSTGPGASLHAAQGASGAGRVAIILLSIGSIAAVNLCGVRQGARLAASATLVKLLPFIVFVAVGAWALAATPHDAGKLPHGIAFGHAMILAVFALCGMETVLGASGEVADPSRTVPRALFGAMLSVVALYVAIQLIAQGLLGASLATSATPLADAMGRVGEPFRLLLLAGAAVSMFGWIASDVLGAPRLLFAFARDGLLPAILGRVHPRTKVPYIAICAHSALAACLALSGSFVPLAVMSTLFTAALYILACASAFLLHRRGVAQAGAPLQFRAVPACAAIGIVSMVLLSLEADWVQIAGLIGTVAASLALYAVSRNRRRPGVRAR